MFPFGIIQGDHGVVSVKHVDLLSGETCFELGMLWKKQPGRTTMAAWCLEPLEMNRKHKTQRLQKHPNARKTTKKKTIIKKHRAHQGKVSAEGFWHTWTEARSVLTSSCMCMCVDQEPNGSLSELETPWPMDQCSREDLQTCPKLPEMRTQ